MSAVAASLQMGIDAESNDPHLRELVTSITPEQIAWIAAWLEGEGFVKDNEERCDFDCDTCAWDGDE